MLRHLFVLSALVACGQSLDFEVATMRPVPSGQQLVRRTSGGPGTANPENIALSGYELVLLVARAYGVQRDQVAGPKWIEDQAYDITAKLPPGTTTAQLNAMLGRLLADRLHVTLHREMRPVPVFEIVVAKGGSKLKPAAHPDAPPATAELIRAAVPDRDGFPQVPEGYSGKVVMMANGRQREAFASYTMEAFCRQLSLALGSGHIVDKTGLTGKYDFQLEYTPRLGIRGPNDELGIEIGPAMEQQLGLKVERTTGDLEVIVVDRADRVPGEN